MREVIIALLICFVGSNAFASGPSFPTGWRSPSDQELKDDWRSQCPNHCAWVAADFTGDGLVEGAFLAVRTDGKTMGLLAFVYDKGGREKWYVLDEIKEPSFIEVMGVEVYPPSTYRVMCQESDKNCDRDGKRPVKMIHPSISYY
jgi:hypothetical protein